MNSKLRPFALLIVICLLPAPWLRGQEDATNDPDLAGDTFGVMKGNGHWIPMPAHGLISNHSRIRARSEETISRVAKTFGRGCARAIASALAPGAIRPQLW